MLTINQAKKLIKLARDSISSYFKQKALKIPESIKKTFGKKQGVFVSLYIKEELMGCIGFPEPTLPLYQAVIRGALGAAFEDPRFPPLKQEQLKNTRIELSVLTIPKEIEVKEPEEYLKEITIGKDGLLIQDEFGSGLLLPQVPIEWKWNAKQFLDHACMKAGLSPDCWNNLKRNVYKFQAQIFTEKDKEIIEKKFI